jgi:hypothetical protein
MPATLHDPSFQASVRARLGRLRPDTKPAWGKMSVDQMLWHCNQGLAMALGRLTPPASRPPIPGAIIKWVTLNLPWPKNAPTAPTFVARQQYDFEAERDRCLAQVTELASQPLDKAQPPHPLFGAMTGREQSRLQAKHLDHHLKQFGV